MQRVGWTVAFALRQVGTFCYTILMIRRRTLLIGLKAATLTLVAIMGIVALSALFRSTTTAPLSGRLVTSQPTDIPTQYVDAAKMERGFQVPPSTHVIFTLPGDAPPIRLVDLFGGPEVLENVRFWGYCFSGREQENEAAGLVGRQMYDGQFFYSTAEQKSQTAVSRPANSDLLGIRQSTLPKVRPARTSEIDVLQGGQTCYVMSDDASAQQLTLTIGVDRDGDRLNSGLESVHGTSDSEIDTDHDGLSDGTEVYGSQRTNPREPDSDRDGIIDGVEDANQNGEQDDGETSSVRADTDGDGLCDGPVMQRTTAGGEQKNSGCPEWADVTTTCSKDAGGERVCRPLPASWLFNQGEDVNANGRVDAGDDRAGIAAETDPRTPDTYGGIMDMQYKISQFTSRQGFNPQNARGTPTPAFPIPSFPQ